MNSRGNPCFRSSIWPIHFVRTTNIALRPLLFGNLVLCCRLHRQPKHLLSFLLAELGTSGSVDGSNSLIIKGRFHQKQIETVLRRYISMYTLTVYRTACHGSGSPWQNELYGNLKFSDRLSHDPSVPSTCPTHKYHILIQRYWLYQRNYVEHLSILPSEIATGHVSHKPLVHSKVPPSFTRKFRQKFFVGYYVMTLLVTMLWHWTDGLLSWTMTLTSPHSLNWRFVVMNDDAHLATHTELTVRCYKRWRSPRHTH